MRAHAPLLLLALTAACRSPPTPEPRGSTTAASPDQPARSLQSAAEPKRPSSQPTAPADEPEPDPALPADAAGDDSELLVGVLARNGQHVCRKNGPPEGEWVDLYPEVGFVPLLAEGAVARKVERLVGKLVVARGKASDRGRKAAPLPPDAKPCTLLAQMRSDWVASPDGFRIRRSPAPRISAFQAHSVEVFTGLSATHSGERLRVRLVNTLQRTLRGPVTLRVHYEGCYGKPGSLSESKQDADGLAPDESFSASFPALVTRPGGAPGARRPGVREHRAYSVEVLASARGVYLDLDARLQLLGASVECP